MKLNLLLFAIAGTSLALPVCDLDQRRSISVASRNDALSAPARSESRAAASFLEFWSQKKKPKWFSKLNTSKVQKAVLFYRYMQLQKGFTQEAVDIDMTQAAQTQEYNDPQDILSKDELGQFKKAYEGKDEADKLKGYLTTLLDNFARRPDDWID